mgnify:CR=1 FL=1
MKRSSVKKTGILERAFNSPVMTSMARTLRLVHDEPHSDSHSQAHAEELLEVLNEPRRIRLHMLEAERQQAEEAETLAHHVTEKYNSDYHGTRAYLLEAERRKAEALMEWQKRQRFIY